MKIESMFKFTESLTKSFATLTEVRNNNTKLITYKVEWRLADSETTSSTTFKGGEYDKAVKYYRMCLNEVLDSIEKWDEL